MTAMIAKRYSRDRRRRRRIMQTNTDSASERARGIQSNNKKKKTELDSRELYGWRKWKIKSTTARKEYLCEAAAADIEAGARRWREEKKNRIIISRHVFRTFFPSRSHITRQNVACLPICVSSRRRRVFVSPSHSLAQKNITAQEQSTAQPLEFNRKFSSRIIIFGQIHLTNDYAWAYQWTTIFWSVSWSRILNYGVNSERGDEGEMIRSETCSIHKIAKSILEKTFFSPPSST